MKFSFKWYPQAERIFMIFNFTSGLKGPLKQSLSLKLCNLLLYVGALCLVCSGQKLPEKISPPGSLSTPELLYPLLCITKISEALYFLLFELSSLGK